MSTYSEVLQEGKIILNSHEIADADVDAWYLLTHVMEIDRTYFLMHRDEKISDEKKEKYLGLIQKRANHIPLQQITGIQEFMGLDFKVNKHVLIPRQDTECLVEKVLEDLKENPGKKVLDLCTGSGCIIVSLAKLGNIGQGVAVDISKEALAVAKENARTHGVEVEFIESDLLEQIPEDYQFDIIVSNPPYITVEEMNDLMVEVREHEPSLALVGGEDGLDFYRRIITASPRYLKQGGKIYFEIGCKQGLDVAALLKSQEFVDIEINKDLSGLDRIVSGRYLPRGSRDY